MAAAYEPMNESNETEIMNEVENWCLNLTNAEADAILNDLGLIQSGSRLARADRLARRLCGDYTATDFVRTNMNDSEIDEELDRIEVRAAIENSQLSRRAQNYITLRRPRRNTIHDHGEESHLAAPLADSTDNNIVTSNAFVLNYFPLSQENSEANYVPIASVGIPTTVTSVQVTIANNTPTTVTTPSVLMTTSVAQPLPRINTSTQATSVHNNQQQQHLVRCQMPNGQYYEVQRELAMEIIRLQQAADYIQTVANQPSVEIPNFSTIRRDLLTNAQDRASSTHIAAPVVVTQACGLAPGVQSRPPGRRRSVNMRDTFDLRYYDRDEIINPRIPTVDSTNNATYSAARLNAVNSAFVPRGAIPRQTTQHAEARQPERPTSGGGGASRAFEAASSQRTPDLSTFALAQRQWDVGRIVRSWKLKFDGSKDSSVEEFIQRVDECRVLAHISDEDLLNAMTELMAGVALFWCRQSRANWTTWADFCAAARRCYGLDPKFHQRLVIEAQTRTQGRNEPVRDYIVCLLTMMSKFEEPWDVDRQLDLLHRNMLPALKQAVKRPQITSVDRLLELAREAEDLILAEKSYKPPPKPEECLLPELAYRELEVAKPDKASRPQVAAIAAVEQKPPLDEAKIAKLVKQLLEAELKEHAKAAAPVKAKVPAPVAPPAAKSEGVQTSAAAPAEKKRNRAKRPAPTPASDKNKNKEPGALSFAACWGCSWPGHTKKTCPECSGNEKGSE